MLLTSVGPEWDLPKLRCSFTFDDDRRYVDAAGPDTEIFDVKFYPYSPAGSAPVFAAVSKRHIFVCRLQTTRDVLPCEVLQLILDDDADALNCACTWSKDPDTDAPLLCVAGRDAKVKVYGIGGADTGGGAAAASARPVRTFVGHGGEINDLATSPADPHLVASASDDTTVRLWSLDAVHAAQPCVCLLGGEGHSWSLLSVAFHDSGRYVLSAGHDQVINLWTLPDVPRDHGLDVPYVVHYPHFSSAEIHTGLIDCVAFFGDLVLSRACHEDVIVLWRIEGFDSTAPPPSPDQAPSSQDTTKLTRSAFGLPAGPSSSPGMPPPLYTRLLQLHTPGCGPQFFVRFGLFNTAGYHPTLAFCNASSKIFFWDFACFEAYRRYMASFDHPPPQGSGAVTQEGAASPTPISRPAWLRVLPPRKRPEHHQHPPGGSSGNAINSRRLREANVGLRDLLASGTSNANATATATRSSVADGSDRDSSIAPTTTAAGASTPDPDGRGVAASATTTTVAPSVRLGVNDLYNAETQADWASKYKTDDPHAQIKAHRVETIKGMPMVGRQVAWSPDGAWCVVVGSNSRIMVLQRWASSDDGEVAGGAV